MHWGAEVAHAFACLAGVACLVWAPTAAAQPRRLSPGCQGLDAPPTLAAAPDLDLSVLEEPHVLAGLLKTPWSPPPDLLQGNRALRVDLMPPDCGEAPLKMANGTLIGPATVAFPMGEVLPLLRRNVQERGFHAYVRHLALDNFPEIAAQLPMARALRLAGPRLQSANLWIGDGGMRSNLHWDGHDNILLQLTGTKTLLILPPEATPHLGYRAFSEHRYLYANGRFTGYKQTGTVVENHALFDAFDADSARLDERIPVARARVATLRPGEALFLPALWSHAVVSTPAGADEGAAAEGLNMAVNLWFTQRSVSHAAALERVPEWTQGWFVFGNDLRSAAR